VNADRVLVVTDDAADRAMIGGWLDRAGYDALLCPGPSAPDYRCIGGRGERCPLAADADVVVLDMQLASDDMMTGSPGWELLLYYMAGGKKIVALASDDDVVVPRSDKGVVVVQRPASEKELLAAVVASRLPVNDRRAG
jgi:CheY-like chemotaxis protein